MTRPLSLMTWNEYQEYKKLYLPLLAAPEIRKQLLKPTYSNPALRLVLYLIETTWKLCSLTWRSTPRNSHYSALALKMLCGWQVRKLIGPTAWISKTYLPLSKSPSKLEVRVNLVNRLTCRHGAPS